MTNGSEGHDAFISATPSVVAVLVDMRCNLRFGRPTALAMTPFVVGAARGLADPGRRLTEAKGEAEGAADLLVFEA